MSDAARAFASKAVVSLLGMIFGNISGFSVPAQGGVSAGTPYTVATGGLIGRASGGSIPTLLTSGEYVIPPVQAMRIGGRMLNALNSGTMRTFAPGGLVRGGSGVRDDVFQSLAEGSYVIKRSSVERYGASNIASLSIGGYPEGADGTSVPLLRAMGGPIASTTSTPSMSSVVSGGGGSFTIGVTINDNSTSSSSNSSAQPGSSLGDRQFGETLARRIKQITLQTMEDQKRVGGMLRPQSNLRNT